MEEPELGLADEVVGDLYSGDVVYVNLFHLAFFRYKLEDII
ncbi:MAG: hypothetical protein R6U98_34030 [Pirellulaceae bacterium]